MTLLIVRAQQKIVVFFIKSTVKGYSYNPHNFYSERYKYNLESQAHIIINVEHTINTTLITASMAHYLLTHYCLQIENCDVDYYYHYETVFVPFVANMNFVQLDCIKYKMYIFIKF